MHFINAEKELAEFLARIQTATWERPRTTNELQSFLSTRFERIDELSEISL